MGDNIIRGVSGAVSGLVKSQLHGLAAHKLRHNHIRKTHLGLLGEKIPNIRSNALAGSHNLQINVNAAFVAWNRQMLYDLCLIALPVVFALRLDDMDEKCGFEFSLLNVGHKVQRIIVCAAPCDMSSFRQHGELPEQMLCFLPRQKGF